MVLVFTEMEELDSYLDTINTYLSSKLEADIINIKESIIRNK